MSDAFDWSVYPWLKGHEAGLAVLATCLRQWNERINLVSRKEVDQLEARHLLPCAALIRVADFSALTTHLDIGTGGGLPGLVVALLYPHLQCTLLDATAKKLKAIEAMAGELGLRNVRTVHTRVEDYRGRHDLVTGRAVTALPRFAAWAAQCLKRGPRGGGLYYWKGGELEPQLAAEGLCPRALHSLEALLGDVFFHDKYIAHFETKALLCFRDCQKRVQQ